MATLVALNVGLPRRAVRSLCDIPSARVVCPRRERHERRPHLIMCHLYDTALRIAGALYPTSPGSDDTQQHLGGPRARQAASLGVRPVRSRRAPMLHTENAPGSTGSWAWFWARTHV
jgi:hypothetical protein